MKKISLTLPDGAKLSFSSGVVGKDVVVKIGPRLAKDAIAMKLNGTEVVDLLTPIEQDASITVLTQKDPESLAVLRHSSAHIMSEAVQSLFTGVKVTIGPATETGFYYDYEYDKGFTPEDLKKITKKMQEIVNAKRPFARSVVPKKEAIKKFKEMNEGYKVEIIQGIEDEYVSIYQQGEWQDLCRGPHIPHSGWIKAFKLLSIAGAYWRGDEKNKMLQRIYGTAFFSKKDLDEFLKLQEEAKKRDHRKLGKALDLFSFHPEAPAMPFFHEKGTILYNTILDYCYTHILSRTKYQIVKTPLIYSDELWKKSGHFENYKENMYFTEQDDIQMAIKPMNCPGHMLMYKNAQHSYRELPIRIAEFGFVHRYERSGVVHGLFRVRGFAQDDAHHFCAEDQVEDEVRHLIDDILKTYQDFGFKDVQIELSTRPIKSIGTEEMWEKAEAVLASALKKSKIQYKLNPGDGAFYGPKIDFHIKDSLHRTWQCGTIQMDFSLPERFDIEYIGQDGHKHRAAMIHRAIFGSPERFMGILIEHYAGAFPLWLAPVQVVVVNVTDNQLTYAKAVAQQLTKGGIRVETDFRNEKLGFKIREAQMKKIPYMCVIGDREMASKTVAPRSRDGKSHEAVSVETFLANLNKNIEQRG